MSSLPYLRTDVQLSRSSRPKKSRHTKREVNWALHDRLEAEGLSQTAIAKRLGLSQGYLSILVKRRSARAPAVQPIANGNGHHGETSPIEELDTRLCVVEAFITTLQRHPELSPLNGATAGATGAPGIKHGFVISPARLDQMRTYHVATGIAMKDLLDLALHEFFTRRGWNGLEVAS
jgi:hypothetical protein